MSELKRVFSQAKMNKDMDERIVPNGQYRDATNIEIATSEGSEVGTVQTVVSNLERNLVSSSLDNFTTNLMGGATWNTLGPHKKSTVVGCVDHPAKDKIYYLVSGGDHSDDNILAGTLEAYGGTQHNIAKDYIIEYDTITQRNRYVFVDIFRVYTDVTTANTSIGSYTFHVSSGAGETTGSGIRVGMGLSSPAMPPGSDVIVTSVTYDESIGNDGTSLNKWKVSTNIPHGLNDLDTVTFTADRVLWFSKHKLITGINILDNTLYWTDNATEPKRINIPRSIAGTGGYEDLTTGNLDAVFEGDTDYFHTRLVVEKDSFEDISDAYKTLRRWHDDSTQLEFDGSNAYLQFLQPIYVDTSNITVIRKGPTQPLELEMYRTSARRVNSDGDETPSNGIIGTDTDEGFAWVSDSGELMTVDDPPITLSPFSYNVDFRVGDVLLVANSDTSLSPNSFTDHDIRVRVMESPVTSPNDLDVGSDAFPFTVKILSIKEGLTTSPGIWYLKLEDKRPTFENKFPRFSYRYKYQDGEYSTFAPWSQIAFLPDRYEYLPKKGYNLGMVNQIRAIRLKYYSYDLDTLPQDVVEIDLLYKESGKPTVYTIKTVKKSDGNTEWPIAPSNLNSFESTGRGLFEIDTDMVHAVVPSNQILRPYDNVPRRALAQEISANRLIYGNYLQNYTVFENPIIRVDFHAQKLSSIDTDYWSDDDEVFAAPSVKTMRKYQMGVVFSDEYGRETPVLTSKKSSIEIPKDWSDTRNRLVCQLSEKSNIPGWAKYFSYYVKEASIEYYTMAMDRWYSAADGNIWLSFPSSERNKLDDETFLILKKAHGSDQAVKDKARYRILAIENEAPDFIKTERKVLGRLYDSGSTPGFVIGNNGSGFPSQGSTFIEISAGEWDDTFGDQVHILTPDSLAIRFYGAGQQSNIYEVSHVSLLGGEGGIYKLQLTKRIEEDAAFISTDDTIVTMIPDLSMDLIELEVENRPEFDGRFFVKIYKDATLEKYVLNAGVEQYSIANTTQIGYLNNNGYASVNQNTGEVEWDTWMLNQGENEPFSNTGLDGDYYNDVYSSTIGVASGSVGDYNYLADTRRVAGTPLHPTEYPHHSAPTSIPGGLGQYAYWWGHSTGSDNNQAAGSINNPGPTPWNNNTYDAYGITARNIDNFSVLSIGHAADGGGDATNGSNGATNFWDSVLLERVFFIDAATAYSWSGREGARPGAVASLGQQDLWSGGPTGGDAVVEIVGVQVGFPTESDAVGNSPNINSTGNTFGKLGQPSRGIWHHGDDDISYMDLSWSGMGNITDQYGWAQGEAQPGIWPGESNGDANWDDAAGEIGIFHRLGDVNITLGSDVNQPDLSDQPGSYASEQLVIDEAWEFIQQLVVPGTKFRFARDPDQIIYEVQDVDFPTIMNGGEVGGGYGSAAFESGTSSLHGVWGIRNYRPGGTGNGISDRDHYGVANLRQRWTIAVSPKIGSQGVGYSPVKGTGGWHMDTQELLENGSSNPTFGTYIGDGPIPGDDEYRRALWHDMTGDRDTIEILQTYSDSSTGGNYTNNPGVWETEPKESADIDIYYQASGLIPLELNESTNEEYLPIQSNNIGGTTFKHYTLDGGVQVFTVTKFDGETITFDPPIATETDTFSNGEEITFTKRNHYSVTGHINMPDGPPGIGSDRMTLHGGPNTILPGQKMFSQKHYLDWNNCWCFGNGVESDRIRDDFNTAQVDNGVKASSVLAEQVREERRKHGLIWSGIYNSNSGVNDVNQFIQAEKITKDLNPIYGSIQRLYNRDTRLIMFCEDKILRGVTNKDALYNADGKPQLVASNAVIGDVTPYQGDYGISTNPESLASTPSTIYFSDAIRGKVLALYDNGLQPISDVGMKDYFSDYMSSYIWRSLGTFDERKKEYNLTVSKKYADHQVQPHDQITVSYSELSKGWTSFKSFYPQQGISLNNNYYTFSSGANNSGSLYEHYAGASRNNFYETPSSSDITLLFNDNPETVKSFMTLNYEGSQANVPQFSDVDDQNYFTGDYSVNSGIVDTDNVNDGEYFNLQSKAGWYADNLTTNMQSCGSIYFKNKENKYYGYPSGETTQHSSACNPLILSNLDESEFSVQGIGLANITHDTPTKGDAIVVTVANRSAITDDWDTASVAAAEISHWTCTEETLCVEGGSVIGDVTVNLTVSSIQDGIYSGYDLSAANFELGDYGLVEGLVYTVNGGSNVTDTVDVDTVTFSDNGIAGDPTNTVNVAVTFHSDQTWPDSDFTYYIDIDEIQVIVKPRVRPVCVRTQYDYWDTTHNTVGSLADNPHWHGGPDGVVGPEQPVVSDIEGIEENNPPNNYDVVGSWPLDGAQTYAQGEGFTQVSPTVNIHTGDVAAGQETMVAEIIFQSNVGAPDFDNVDTLGYLQGVYYTGLNGENYPTVTFENLGQYEGYYTGEIILNGWSTIGNNNSHLTGFTVRVYYTPPPLDLLPDPPIMCELQHTAVIHYAMKAQGGRSGGKEIGAVIYNSSLPHRAESNAIRVLGEEGSTYQILVQKTTSITDGSVASSGYYNFTTRTFESGLTADDYTIGSSGVNAHIVSFPNVTSDTRYDVIIKSLPNSTGEMTVLGPRVPVAAGDASIIKYGVKQLTLQPVTATAANFGTLPTQVVTKPGRYNGDSYKKSSAIRFLNTTGGNSSVSSTKIIVKQNKNRIKKGMLLVMPFSGNIIPHNTKVISVRDNEITLNNAVTLADNTDIKFINNANSVTPFSLTIPPGSGKTLYLKPEAVAGSEDGVDFRKTVRGIGKGMQASLTAAVDNNINIYVDEGSKAVKAGMAVSGEGIVADPAYGYARIAAIANDGVQYRLTTPQTLADETVLHFSWPEDDPALPEFDLHGGGNDDVDVIHLQTSIDDGDLLIQGYLKVRSINRTDDLSIYIDDFVNVN